MATTKYYKVAAQFTAAIKALAEKPGNLDNLECYLAHNFPVWLEMYASTPEDITAELREFASMEI